MSGARRKSRNEKDGRERAAKAFTCFSKIIIPFFLLGAFSCSQISKKSKDLDLKQELKALCLDASGKGRFETAKTKYSFSYDSILNHKEKVWSLGVLLPLGHQEVLHLNYNADAKKFMSGTFHGKMKRSLAQKDIRRVDQFLNLLRKLIQNKVGEKEGNILVQRNGENIELYQGFKNKEKVLITLSRKDRYFKKVEISYLSPGSPKALFKMLLYPQSCSAS